MVTNLGSVSSLFASSYFGLQNAYQMALQDGATGITQNDLLNSGSKYLYYGNSNAASFSSYLTTNFKGIDKNKDGTISSDEMSNVITSMGQQGLTYEQLMTAGSSAGMSSQDLNAILTNFRQIDRNGDGKISSTEISYYSTNKKVNDKISELKNKISSNVSIFYPDDSDDNSSSSSFAKSSII